MRRVLRITVKLGLIAAVGVAIAVVVKKLTAPPSDTAAAPEPWPPLSTEPSAGDGGEPTPADEPAPADDIVVVEETVVVDVEESTPSSN